jgi:hypothetical protein
VPVTNRSTWVQRTEEAIDDRTAPAPGERKYAAGPRAKTADRFAGGVGGALYLAGPEPELEGETLDADDRPSIGTTLRDPHTDARGR